MTPYQFTLGAYDDSTFQNLKIHPDKAMHLNLSLFTRKASHALNLKRVTELASLFSLTLYVREFRPLFCFRRI